MESWDSWKEQVRDIEAEKIPVAAEYTSTENRSSVSRKPVGGSISRKAVSAQSELGGSGRERNLEKEIVPPAQSWRIASIDSGKEFVGTTFNGQIPPAVVAPVHPYTIPQNAGSQPHSTYIGQGPSTAQLPSQASSYHSNPTHQQSQSQPSPILQGPGNLPTERQVHIHLRLLYAFQLLKAEVFFTSGMLDIHDNWLPTSGPPYTPDIQKSLNRIREKRWAVFVSRATDRFTAWWEALKQTIYCEPVTCGTLDHYSKENVLTDRGLSKTLVLTRDHLPPLDVLMVWHSFMLSPQRYLEDCLLQGMMGLWHGGFPWDAVEQSLSPGSGAYDPGRQAAFNFTALANRSWVNVQEKGIRVLDCPFCAHHGVDPAKHAKHIMCSNFGRLLSSAQKSLLEKMNMGQPIFGDVEALCGKAAGWADPGYLVVCQHCKCSNTQDALRAQKLVRDIMQYYRTQNVERKFKTGYVQHLKPMPGTIFGKNGTPRTAGMINGVDDGEGFFPIRLMDAIANIDVSGAKRSAPPNFNFSMDALLRDVNNAMYQSPPHINYAQLGGHNLSVNMRNGVMVSTVDPKEMRAMKRTLRYYLDNSSPFSLDLTTAVLRNGVFNQRMENLGWWRDLTFSQTVTRRLIEKYRRFSQLHTKMSLLSTGVAIPTVDVDLIWHTHLMMPSSYYTFSLNMSGRLVDHCDKIPETHLSTGFVATCKKYEAIFNEPFSECVCWYCDAIRAGISGGLINSILNLGKKDKDKSSALHPLLSRVTADPNLSTHLSNHNAVRVEMPVQMAGAGVGAGAEKYAASSAEHGAWLDEACGKAVDKASREGRVVPLRTEVRPWEVNWDVGGNVAAAPTARVSSWIEEVLREMYGF